MKNCQKSNSKSILNQLALHTTHNLNLNIPKYQIVSTFNIKLHIEPSVQLLTYTNLQKHTLFFTLIKIFMLNCQDNFY